MRLYLDTSVLVAMLVREAGTEAAKTCLSTASGQPLLISRWTVTELSSALALKLRMAAIGAEEQTAALAMFRRLCATLLRTIDVEARDYESAARLCDQAALPVRAGDALHLAICQRTGAHLATFDTGMAAAAARHGLACDLLGPSPADGETT